MGTHRWMVCTALLTASLCNCHFDRTNATVALTCTSSCSARLLMPTTKKEHAVLFPGRITAHLHQQLQRALSHADEPHAVVQAAGAQPALRNLKAAPLACIVLGAG